MTSIYSVEAFVKYALHEDAPEGDITSNACVPKDERVDARIISKGEGVIAGIAYAEEAFRQCGVDCKHVITDGTQVNKGDLVLTVSDAPARGVLRAERVALNFLGHLSGVATASAYLSSLMEGKNTVLLDTRKTTPGFRAPEKAAVVAGGASNHRQDLSDGFLIKENHIRAAGGITPAVKACLKHNKKGLQVECEVTNLEEAREAIEAGATMILLDNMPVDQMKIAVKLARDAGVKTEASGNVSAANIRDVAGSGVDYISSGWITHSAPWLDLSLLIEHK